MSWMSKKYAAKREAQRAKVTAGIATEGWAPPVTAHDARMATGEDICNSPDHDHSRELTDAEVAAALYEQQEDPVPAAGQDDEVGYYEPGGEGERRAKVFWEHGLPPVEELEREIYTRLDAETVTEADSQAAETDAERLSRRFLASLRKGDIGNARLLITVLADLAASTDESPDGHRDHAAQEFAAQELAAYQSMADRFHQGESARSAAEAEMFEFFRETGPDQDR